MPPHSPCILLVGICVVGLIVCVRRFYIGFTFREMVFNEKIHLNLPRHMCICPTVIKHFFITFLFIHFYLSSKGIFPFWSGSKYRIDPNTRQAHKFQLEDDKSRGGHLSLAVEFHQAPIKAILIRPH